MPCRDDRDYDCSDIHDAHQLATRVACEALKMIEKELPKKNIGNLSNETQKWWTGHKQSDKIREEKERKVKIEQDKKQKALSKLTKEERELLGIRESILKKV